MTEHDRAIRMAQKLLRTRAEGMPDVELSYGSTGKPKEYYGFLQAARELEALVIGD